MEKPIDIKLSKLQKIFTVLPPIILILSNIFLFGPFTIYQGNLSEFAISFTSIIHYYLLPSLILIVALSALGILLPDKLQKCYISILFILGILIWLQGNIFLWDYGVIGKGEIDWTKGAWRGWLDATVWIMLFISAILFYRYIYRFAKPASIALVSLQVALLIFNSVQQPEVWKGKNESSQSPDGIFQFSSKQNVIHIILDELQSDILQEIIEKDTSYYHNVFGGFTFFNETVGSFPTTIMSIPAFLSGQNYQSDVTIQDFIDTVYSGKTIPNVLYDHGFEVDLAAEQAWYGYGRHTNWYYIPVPYGVSINENARINSAYMMGLVILRHAPHFLKKPLSVRSLSLAMLSLNETESYEALRHLSHKAFLQDLIDNVSIKRNKPVYKLIHLTTTHWPIVINENCEFAGKILPFNWKNIKIQAKCSLDHFIQFLNKLKQMGIYDASLIIIHADHGYWKVPGSIKQVKIQNLVGQLDRDFPDEEDCAEKVCASLPFLSIKLPFSKGHMATSSAQAAITDVPATIGALLNLNEKFNGRSVFDIDPNEVRERKFYYYYELNHRGDKYFNRIDEYLIKGSARDRASWQFVSLHLPPGEIPPTGKIVFGTGTAARFLRSGWSFNEMDPDNKGLTYSWALGKSASLLLELPKTRVQLTANVKSFFSKESQSVTVKVDGEEVGTWKNSKQWEWEKHSVTIEADANRSKTSKVEFIFSIYREPDEKETRELALLFESITLEEQ